MSPKNYDLSKMSIYVDFCPYFTGKGSDCIKNDCICLKETNEEEVSKEKKDLGS